MKMTTLKSALLSAMVAGSSMIAIAPATAQAGVSANVGVVSNYVFRGVQQTSDSDESLSPQLQGGLDYEGDSGLYFGVWGSSLMSKADDENYGLEYDIYGGFSGESGDVSYGIGATYYGYTDSDWDEGYVEMNLSAGYGFVSGGLDIGDDKNLDDDSGYMHYYVSFDGGEAIPGLGLTIGAMDPETSGSDTGMYADLGYGVEVSGFDLGANVVYSNEDIDDETYFFVSATKSFDLM